MLLAGISLTGLWTALGFLNKPDLIPKKTIKFLTEDGKLVEIDADKLPTASRPASKADIQQWIKK